MIAARIVKHILNLRRKIAVIIALVAFLTVIVHAGEKVERTTEEFRSFLSSIEGSWKGQAVKTPVGPRPYDIRFRRTSNALVEGHANPGEEATHYWTFFLAEQIPSLRFLSTFAGNRRPLILTASAASTDEWRFNAPDPDYLEVRVKPRKHNLTITIFIRGELHVEIKLTRPDDDPRL